MLKKALMIRWKLNEVMARYRITGVALAKELGVRDATVSNLRTSETMPRIDGKKAEELTNALTKLANTTIRFTDLLEESYEPPDELSRQKPKANFNHPIPA